MSSQILGYKAPAGISIFLIACLGHFIVDFSIGLWPVWKTIAHYDLALSGLIAGVSVMLGESMQSIFSVWADRGFWRPLIAIGCLISSLGLAMPLTSSVYGAGFLFFLTCLGSSAFHPTAVGLISSLQGMNRTVLIAIFHSSGLLGLGISQTLFSNLLEKHPAMPLSLSWLSIFLAIMLFVTQRRHRGEVKSFEEIRGKAIEREKVSMRVFLDFLQRSDLRKLYLLLLCNQTMTWSLLFLLPDFLLERGASRSFAYGGGHLIYVFGAACACVPLGILAKRLNTPLVILMTYVVSIFLLASSLFINIADSSLLALMLFALGGAIGAIAPLSLALGNDLEPTRSATVSAFLMGFVWIFSEGIGYSLSSYIAASFTASPATNALSVMGLTLFLGVIQSFLLYRELLDKKPHGAAVSADL